MANKSEQSLVACVLSNTEKPLWGGVMWAAKQMCALRDGKFKLVKVLGSRPNLSFQYSAMQEAAKQVDIVLTLEGWSPHSSNEEAFIIGSSRVGYRGGKHFPEYSPFRHYDCSEYVQNLVDCDFVDMFKRLEKNIFNELLKTEQRLAAREARAQEAELKQYNKVLPVKEAVLSELGLASNANIDAAFKVVARMGARAKVQEAFKELLPLLKP